MNLEKYVSYVSVPFALVALSTSLPAQALPIQGTASGVFVNPTVGVTTTGVGTSDFTFGDASISTTGPNRFTFTGVSFNTETETPFLIGTFSYFNGTTSGREPSLSSVDLQLGLNFTTPAVGVQTSSFNLGAFQTLNTGTPDENADSVFLPNAFSSTVFTLGGTQYTLQLLGFDNVVGDGFLTSTNTQLNAREGGTASAQLFGLVTAKLPEPPTAVPEPFSILSVLSVTPALLMLRRKSLS